ncbi:hypothetical protein [Paraburkholderia bannensis]|uniref:hypothetical protein n=1 Tax=Paraburkholderia bannensis TaxID=765414 RepID=UPI002ABE36AE|nr:hypothetical protein [Paraburkholderia bannensis]
MARTAVLAHAKKRCEGPLPERRLDGGGCAGQRRIKSVTTECNPRWTKSAGCPGNNPIDAVRFQWGGFYRDVGNTTLISKGFQCAAPDVGHMDKARIARNEAGSSSRAVCRYAEEIRGTIWRNGQGDAAAKIQVRKSCIEV